MMSKNQKRFMWLGIGLVLWMFFFVQEEFAFYGIYTLFDFSVHEIASVIPMISFLVTLIWLFILIKKIIQKKSQKGDKWFSLLLVALLLIQGFYFNKQSQEVHTMMVVKVESIDRDQGTITLKNAYGDEKNRITCSAPELIIHLVEVGEQNYLASFVYDKATPEVGKLSMLKLENVVEY